MKLTALVRVRSGVGDDSEVSGAEENKEEKKAGWLRPLEIMGKVGPSDRRPPESMRWMIALKTHPAKVELSRNLRKRSYVSRRCLSSSSRANSTTYLAIRMDLKSIAQRSYEAENLTGYTAITRCEKSSSSCLKANVSAGVVSLE